MEDDDFWSSKSVSSSIKNTNVNHNDYDNNYGENIDSSINTETKKIILPNLGYSNEDKSFYFKFNTIKEIDSFTLPKTVNIKLLNQYNFYIDDILLSDEFLVVPGLSEEAIIGAATLQKWRIKLDFEHDTVHVDPKVARIQLI